MEHTNCLLSKFFYYMSLRAPHLTASLEWRSQWAHAWTRNQFVIEVATGPSATSKLEELQFVKKLSQHAVSLKHCGPTETPKPANHVLQTPHRTSHHHFYISFRENEMQKITAVTKITSQYLSKTITIAIFLTYRSALQDRRQKEQLIPYEDI